MADPPAPAKSTGAQAGGGVPSSDCDAASDRRRPDLDDYLQKNGLRIDWGQPHWDANLSWKQGILHETAVGAYGVVFRCLPLNPLDDVLRLVVKVNIQANVNEEEQQAKRKFSTSYMIENAAFTCVPHVAIVRSRARFTKSSSLEAARLSFKSIPQAELPKWLRKNVSPEFLVMDLCEGGDLLHLRPTTQPWFNPFSVLEPPEHRISLQKRTDSQGNVYVYVNELPVDVGFIRSGIDRSGRKVQLPKKVGGFQQGDVLLSVRWWDACDAAASGGNWKEEAVTSLEQAECTLQSIVPGVSVASVKVRRSGLIKPVIVPVGYSSCSFNAAAVGAVQKQLVHALWLLQSYRIGHFDLKMGECCCSFCQLSVPLMRRRQRVPRLETG